MIALALALQGPPRIITTPDLHLGLRPHVLVSPGEVGFALTLQLTVRRFL